MSTIQGMCKNCGSLIYFNSADDKCECIFCHCVFPSVEAKAILQDPSSYTFPKEEYPDLGTNATRHYAIPVFPEAPKTSTEGYLAQARREDTEKKFVVTPKDVKAPMKTIIITVAITVLCLGIVAAISIPLYFSRVKLHDKIVAGIDSVFEDEIEVDTTIGEEGYAIGYSVSGASCQNLRVVTSDEVSQEDAQTIYENYCQLRATSKGSDDLYSGVSVLIFCEGGVYTVTHSGSTTTAEFAENVEFTPVETTAETTEDN